MELGSLSNLSWYAGKNFNRGLIAFSTKSSLYKEEYECKKLMRETTATSRLEKNSEECEKIKWNFKEIVRKLKEKIKKRKKNGK